MKKTPAMVIACLKDRIKELESDKEWQVKRLDILIHDRDLYQKHVIENLTSAEEVLGKGTTLNPKWIIERTVKLLQRVESFVW